jgi:hypothetical protein
MHTNNTSGPEEFGFSLSTENVGFTLTKNVFKAL